MADCISNAVLIAAAERAGQQFPSGIEAIVCQDITSRQQLGTVKYGTTVADNPLPLRDWLQHQYQELLDAAIYCRRAMEELE